jgi:cytochrome c2
MTRAAADAVFLPTVTRTKATRTSGWTRWFGYVAFLVALFGCEDAAKPARDTEATPSAVLAAGFSSTAVTGSAAGSVGTGAPTLDANAGGAYRGGDKERGKALVETFECTRCHVVSQHKPAARDKNCVTCHDDISRGAFPAPADAIHRWQKTVEPYVVNPSLASVGARFEPEWLFRFLLDPADLRPHLATSMPKLALSETDAADLVAHLTDGAAADTSEPPPGNASRGRELIDQKSCTTCHAFAGVPAFATLPNPKPTDEQQKRAVRLAPDLRFARERFRPAAMVAWLVDPKGTKADTLMPTHGLTPNDAADVTAYLYTAELTLPPPPPMPTRLPVLERRVEFQEVMDKVFGVTCRHCHSDPDASLGDGGPGNTGGFGFAPKGLDLATYRGVAAGYLDAKKERTSVFLPLEDGTPRLLAALLARQMEERGQRRSDVRGMPLGLPALTPEQIQLVESWIAQGRPR